MKYIKLKIKDAERNRKFYFPVGLIIALALTLTAFEWKSYDLVESDSKTTICLPLSEEMIPITIQRKPPKPLMSVVINDLKKVKVNVEVKDDQPDAIISDKPIEPIADVVDVPFEIEKPDDQEPFIVVESMPEFPGGDGALFDFISEELNYPFKAREALIQGKIYVGFVVRENGEIADVEIKRGIQGGELLHAEAIRLVKSMPDWIPGKQRGRAVPVRFVLPVNFELR